MNSPDGLRQEIAALRERISRLNAAILRISASLDLDTVLPEVVDSARALTGARYGMIATVDEGGAIRSSSPPTCRRSSAGTWRTGRTGISSSNPSGTFRARCAWQTRPPTPDRSAIPAT